MSFSIELKVTEKWKRQVDPVVNTPLGPITLPAEENYTATSTREMYWLIGHGFCWIMPGQFMSLNGGDPNPTASNAGVAINPDSTMTTGA
jgi:hypothetical protein